jgi:hypothetical protein
VRTVVRLIFSRSENLARKVSSWLTLILSFSPGEKGKQSGAFSFGDDLVANSLACAVDATEDSFPLSSEERVGVRTVVRLIFSHGGYRARKVSSWFALILSFSPVRRRFALARRGRRENSLARTNLVMIWRRIRTCGLSLRPETIRACLAFHLFSSPPA